MVGHQVRGHGAKAGEFAAVDLLDQGFAGREVAVERADADPCFVGDGLHLDGVTAGGECAGGGVDDALPVALGVPAHAGAWLELGNRNHLISGIDSASARVD